MGKQDKELQALLDGLQREAAAGDGRGREGPVELDPRVVKAGFDLSGYYIQAGRKSFADYAQTMIAEYGPGVRPYLKSWYLSVRYYPGVDPAGMDSADRVAAEDDGESQAVPPTSR